MNEDFLHYIWKYKLFEKETLITNNGKQIEILSTGMHNHDAGPDFLNAKIKIEDTIWVGNVEIHINASDWDKHLHQHNPAYNNVILHVVYLNDAKVFNNNKQEINTLSLHFDDQIFKKYESLKSKTHDIACHSFVEKIDNFTLSHWTEKLLIERLEQKTQLVENLLESTKNDWNECFYIFLSRSFGFNLNNYAFEMLAKSLPQRILAKHKNNLFALEALLFGQAGMLTDKQIDDEYYLNLQKEYAFLQKKYELTPIESYLWKFLRLRPVNFPTIRISQLARLIHDSQSLLSQIVEMKSLKELENLFDLQVSEYWLTHYTFGKLSEKKNKSFGKSSIDLLIINSIIPFLFLYGKKQKQAKVEDFALQLLENIKPEENKIISQWRNLNVSITNAQQSQAFLQLYNEYCKPQKCLWCAIGNKVLRM